MFASLIQIMRNAPEKMVLDLDLETYYWKGKM